MDLSLYIKKIGASGYEQLDLFKDENVEINLAVKNLSDISKIRSDFTQTFSIPCSNYNNQLFEYWYNADVDGTFNANIRIDAYIEINSTPFRFGSLQLEDCKLRKGEPYSYSVTFFGAGVNLSDKFGDDMLSVLDLSAFNHDYSSSVMDAINDSHLSSGDIYYPLISAMSYMEYGTNSSKDIHKNSNDADYRDFKPAIRLIRIIEAIEQKYDVTFSRDFFDRAVFYNLFMWLHREAGRMKTSSTALPINFTSKATDIADWTLTPDEIDLTSDSVRLNWATSSAPLGGIRNNDLFWCTIKVTTASTVNYKVEVFDNGNLYETFDNLYGSIDLTVYKKNYVEDNSNHLFTFKVSSIQGNITFTTQVFLLSRFIDTSTGDVKTRSLHANSSSQTTANSILKINEQIPEFKVKDFFNSLINQFNLILKPTSQNSYYVDTLDNWYSKGKAYDISNLVDQKEITIKKPMVKKQIEFLYQKTDTILGKRYYEAFQIGYGDLRALYDVKGDDLKIETQFENLMFEKLFDQSGSSPVETEYQAGFDVDISFNTIKGKPFIFYRNGIDSGGHLHIKPSLTYTSTWHTATEDNKTFNQVTNSLNFGADNSTYFFAPIDTGLYFNFWKTYIEDLYNRKTRVIKVKCNLPVRILYQLGLNDRFIIGDHKYKISTIRADITNGDSDLELFTDLSTPFDSVDSVIPLTIDTTEVTIDSDIITIDTVSTHSPVTSYIINGVSITTYTATKGEENFEVKIDANTNWNVTNSNSWVYINKLTGKRSDYLRVKVATNSGGSRTGTFDITIGADTFTITINQA